MTQNDIKKLKNTLRPQVARRVRKTLLKQQSGRKMDDRLMERFQTVVKDRRYQELDNQRLNKRKQSLNVFPTKDALTIFKNQHTMNNYVGGRFNKIYDALQAMIEDTNAYTSNPRKLSQVFDSEQINKIIQMVQQNGRYRNQGGKYHQIVSHLNRLKNRVKQVNQKLRDYTKMNINSSVQVFDVLNSNEEARRFYEGLIKQYNIKQHINIIIEKMQQVIDVVKLQDQKEDNSNVDYGSIILQDSKQQGYSDLFVKKAQADKQWLNKFAQDIISGKVNNNGIQNVLKQYWYYDPDTVYIVVQNIINQLTRKYGIDDIKKEKHALKHVTEQILKGAPKI